MLSNETSRKRIKGWLDDINKKGTSINGYMCIAVDYKKKEYSFMANCGKDSMAQSLAGLFLEDKVMWSAFRSANRIACATKRELETKQKKGKGAKKNGGK